MKKWIFLLLPALLFTGCASLLERTYNVVEPYTNRYWASGAEDTLRVENYQDLVNSLLLLIDQHAEEATIRCYGDANAYTTARTACLEVQRETIPGSYLLDGLTFSFTQSDGADYRTLNCQISYREGAEDLDTMMTLSDSQSLVDLLRVSAREGMGKLTARFVRDTSREEVIAAVESFWAELCRGEDPVDGVDGSDIPPEEEEALQQDPDSFEDEESFDDPPEVPPDAEAVPADGGMEGDETMPDPLSELEPPEEPNYPPCPWKIQFYPDKAETSIVEILLTPLEPYQNILVREEQ